MCQFKLWRKIMQKVLNHISKEDLEQALTEGTTLKKLAIKYSVSIRNY